MIAEEIHKIFIDAVNKMIRNKAEIIANLRESIKIVSDISALELQRDKHRTEMEILADMVAKLVQENARIAQDQTEYNKRYSSLMKRYEAEKSVFDAIEEQIADAHRRVQAIERFIKNVQDLGVLTEFDEELWGLLVESVTVYSKDDIRVAFKN